MNSLRSIEEILFPENAKRNIPNDDDILMQRSGAGVLADEWEMLKEHEVSSWLEDVDDISSSGELKTLINYVRDVSKQGELNVCGAMTEAMSRVVSNMVLITEKWTSAKKYINYGFCSCFKALIYLQNHGVDIRKDVKKIAGIVRDPDAYCQIALICSKFIHRYSGVMNETMAIIGNCPELITEESYEDLLIHLCDLADQTSEWKSKHTCGNWKLYGKSTLVDKKISLVGMNGNENHNFVYSENVQESPFFRAADRHT